jgi:hypothetical protein
MKNTVKIAIAAAALALFGGAQASTIQIQTAASSAGSFASALDYKTAVDAAVAHVAASTVSSYDNLAIGLDNSALKSTINFGVSASNAGAWEIRAGVDFGKGGAIYLDGVAQTFKTNDMWWGGSYSNTSQSFDITSTLAAGNHTLTIYGLENCCSGNQQTQFKVGNGNFTSFNNNDGLAAVAAVPEPETYAMLLAGLGMMGAIARRRKNRAASV